MTKANANAAANAQEQQAAQQPQDAEEPVVLEDEAVPLAANPAGEDNCIIHWIMMILTIVFAGYNVVRAVLRQKRNA